MTFLNNHGNEISMQEFEDWDTEITNEEFDEWEPVGEVVYGSLKPINSENTTVSFVCPVSMKDRIASVAKEHNCSKSDLLRSFVTDGLAKIS